MKHLEQDSAYSKCCVYAVIIMLPVGGVQMGLGDLASPWRELCAWNSFLKKRKILSLSICHKQPSSPTLTRHCISHLCLSFIALAPGGRKMVASPFSRWAVAAQWQVVACSRSASLLSSDLRAPSSLPNSFPTHLSAVTSSPYSCHLNSCCGHSGGRGP